MNDPVQAQYEAFPYPLRDPADEKRRLIDGSPSNLKEIDHYVFAGRRDFARPFRALVAGGGTGDGLIMLAQQLADRGTPALSATGRWPVDCGTDRDATDPGATGHWPADCGSADRGTADPSATGRWPVDCGSADRGTTNRRTGVGHPVVLNVGTA